MTFPEPGNRALPALLLGCALAGCAHTVRATSTSPMPTAETAPMPAGNPSAPAPLPAGAADLETAIPRLLAGAEVPGLSVALVEDGRVAWTRGFGVANASTRAPVTERTVFEAASLSKPVFAFAVLKLVESGRLELDAPLSRYLPEPYVRGDERLHAITARRVLSHTTGFPNWARGTPLAIGFTPGERFSYSGEGFEYLRKVVERITAEPFDALMRRTVFDPLGMASSSYVWQDRYDTLKAHGHDELGRVAGRGRSPEPNAAASLETTAADYARFVAAVLRGEGLREETLREMMRAQIAVDESCMVCLGRQPGPASGTFSWGLGWGLQRTGRGDVLWHWGDNGPMKAYVAALPGERRAVVMLSNGANGLSLAPEIVRRALGIEQPQVALMGVETYDSPTQRLRREVLARGRAALDEHRARWKAGDGGAALTEAQVNGLGYQLLRRERFAEAIEVFRWNVDDHPESANAHDSLGEAYMKAGEKALAVRHYRRSLELDPASTGAAEWLRRLETPVVRLAPRVLDGYAGQYDTPAGKLTVARRGERLLAHMDEQPESTLVPWSETRFWVEGARPEVEFVRGADGRAVEVVLHVGTQVLRGRRIR